MHSSYLNPAIRELRDQQVRFAPREKKLEQADQAERLLTELEADRLYPYEYLCYRITRFRPRAYPDLKVSGNEARHDLRLWSRTSPTPPTSPPATPGRPSSPSTS